MRFETLYHFSHGAIHLVETRRLDLPADASPADIYQWTLCRDSEVIRLHFVSMSLNPQRRVFGEGSIKFDLKTCEGMLMGEKLELLKQDTMSEKLLSLLTKSLKEKAP